MRCEKIDDKGLTSLTHMVYKGPAGKLGGTDPAEVRTVGLPYGWRADG